MERWSVGTLEHSSSTSTTHVDDHWRVSPDVLSDPGGHDREADVSSAPRFVPHDWMPDYWSDLTNPEQAREAHQEDRRYAVQANLQRCYEVRQVDRLLESGVSALAECIASRPALIVTTPTVARLYGIRLQARLRSQRILVPIAVVGCREGRKTMRQVERLCAEAHSRGLGRKSVLIGLGGGVCTDLVTMAASLIRRGIAYVRIPTTLLGQVDAGIGIKGAVNTAYKKSALGCYYPPESVFVDTNFLRTLPHRHISAGLAEMLKVALVCDPELFGCLERHASQLLEYGFDEPRLESQEIIWRSISRMLDELSCNLYENQSYKRLVDFGHTFSPLIEASSGFRVPHGEAVAVDMALSCAVACRLGLLDESSRDRAILAIMACGLPINSSILTADLCADALREATAHRAGSLNLVVPKSLGCGDFIERVQDVPIQFLRSAIVWLSSFAREASIRRRPGWVSPDKPLSASQRTGARAAIA